MKTTIIILTWNQLQYTQHCIESIRTHTTPGTYEIIVVDNASSEDTIEWLHAQSDLTVIYNSENKGFPVGCNQGMEIAKGNNILLLNNDVVVTQNWLDNLVSALYSEDDIGAVGPVTNSAAYYSTIPVDYTSISEMNQYASNYNVSNPDKWEERLKLIGFCLLIKREAFDKVGLLDERFTPGNFEDDDYSIRLRKAGYRLMICKDTFIHHFGSVSWKENINAYSDILTENESRFKAKWGTDSNSYRIEFEMVDLISVTKKEMIKVLHIGCGSGGTLLKVKNEYPQAQLYGIENNLFSIEEASRFAKISNSINEEEIRERKFDFILYTDGCSRLDDTLIRFIAEHLEGNGRFIAKVPNTGHCKVLQTFLNGDNPAEGHNMYSLKQLERMTQDAGFRISITGLKSLISEDQKRLINQITAVCGDAIRPVLESSYFLVSGQLVNGQLLSLLDQLVSGQNVLEQLNQYPEEQIIALIKENNYSVVEILNNIAVKNFSAGYHEYVLSYLHAAFNEEQEDTNTLYNLAFVLHSYGEKELANDYLSRIKNQDKEVRRLFQRINEGKLNNENLPLVSILIPTYNRPYYFELALQSALNQTYKNVEVIVCDDSTNDETAQLITKYTKEYDNLTYIKNETQLGQFENDIKLFNLANGEYINYLMDDDLFSPDKIEKMMVYFVKDINKELKLVTSNRKMISEDSRVLPENELTKPLFDRDTVLFGRDLGNLFLKYNFNCIGEPTTVLFRKSDLAEPFGTFLGRTYGCNVDSATWLTLLSEGNAVYISQTLSYFRVHEGQQLQSTNMILMGACDYAHEVLNARKKGFLENNEDFIVALTNCKKYLESVLNKKIFELKENGYKHEEFIGYFNQIVSTLEEQQMKNMNREIAL